MKKAGIIILIIGLALTIFTTVTFFTREKIVDMGDIQISANKRHNLNWSPFYRYCRNGGRGCLDAGFHPKG